MLVIGLDRVAKRNAFDLPMWNELCRAYGELERDPELRVGVLFAHGDHFTGGLDLPQWARRVRVGRACATSRRRARSARPHGAAA